MDNFPDIAKPTSKKMSVEERFQEFIRSLCGFTNKEGCVNLIDMQAMHNGLAPMIIVKKGTTEQSSTEDQPKFVVSELYIQQIHIASGTYLGQEHSARPIALMSGNFVIQFSLIPYDKQDKKKFLIFFVPSFISILYTLYIILVYIMHGVWFILLLLLSEGSWIDLPTNKCLKQFTCECSTKIRKTVGIKMYLLRKPQP